MNLLLVALGGLFCLYVVAAIVILTALLADQHTQTSQLRAEVEQVRTDVQYVAAWVFANEEQDDSGCGQCIVCGVDEIVQADPTLRDLAGQGWLLERNDP